MIPILIDLPVDIAHNLQQIIKRLRFFNQNQKLILTHKLYNRRELNLAQYYSI